MNSYKTTGPDGTVHQFNSTRSYTHVLWWNRPEGWQVLATLGAYHLGEPMPFPIKDRHTLALEAIA